VFGVLCKVQDLVQRLQTKRGGVGKFNGTSIILSVNEVVACLQGFGRHLWLAHGFFLANGGCGYVRKPEFFYPPSTETSPDGSSVEAVFDPTQPRPVRRVLRVGTSVLAF
jgi:hypothetical protein